MARASVLRVAPDPRVEPARARTDTWVTKPRHADSASWRWCSRFDAGPWCDPRSSDADRVVEANGRVGTATELTMTVGAFAPRSRDGARLAWFLGAGTSAAAGIPTGYDMILDFKTRLFSRRRASRGREVDPSDPLWRERIEDYFDGAQGCPAWVTGGVRGGVRGSAPNGRGAAHLHSRGSRFGGVHRPSAIGSLQHWSVSGWCRDVHHELQPWSRTQSSPPTSMPGRAARITRPWRPRRSPSEPSDVSVMALAVCREAAR